MAAPTKLTQEIHDQIVASLKAGCFRHIAAQQAGISRQTLLVWLKSKKHHEFRKDVLKAEAHARAQAEASVFRNDPKFWLRCGPGRQRVDDRGQIIEGWTETCDTRPAGPTNILVASEEWMLLQKAILKALEPHPEARVAVANAIAASRKKALPNAEPNAPN